MGMSMHCEAVKPADGEYKLKAEAWRACEAAGVPIPEELQKFFNYEEPDLVGTTVNLDRKHESCAEWTDDGRQGYQVDVTKLPPGTRFVRFYCSW